MSTFHLSKRPLLSRLKILLKKRVGFRKPKPQALIVSFPKCGRTWLRMMLGKALAHAYHLHSRDPLEIQEFHRAHPEIPVIDIEHEGDPFNKAPSELNRDLRHLAGTRIVFLVRDPRDVVVSSWFEKSLRCGVKSRRRDGSYNPNGRTQLYSGTLEEFIDEPVGSLATLLEYYTLWFRQREDFSHFCLMRYEDLHSDLLTQLTKVVSALGIPPLPTESLRYGIEEAAFHKMRKLEASCETGNPRLLPGDLNNPESFKTRKGVVGGYREYLSESAIISITQRIRDSLPEEFGYFDDSISTPETPFRKRENQPAGTAGQH